MPVSQFALCTLGQVKQRIKVPGATPALNNWLINEINETSAFIERYTRRRFVAREYQEDLDGKGNDRIFPKNKPILAIQTLIDDTDRKFNSGTYVIPKKDQIIYEKEGYVKVFDGTGVFTKGKQNIRIRYVAGYADLEVDWDKTRFDFRERAASTIYTVTIPPDVYQPYTLATRINTAMNSLGLNTYQVRYDNRVRKYSITLATGATNTLQLLFNDATTVADPLPPVMGYATSANLTGATVYTSSTKVQPRVPYDIEQACIALVDAQYEASNYSSTAGQVVKSEKIGDYSISYFGDTVGTQVQDAIQTLERWKRVLIR